MVFLACMPLPLPYHPQIRNFSLSDLTVTVISGTQSSVIAPHKKKWAQMVEMAHLYLFIFVFLSGIHCDHFLHSCWIIRGKVSCYVSWIVHFISLHCKMHITSIHCTALPLHVAAFCVAVHCCCTGGRGADIRFSPRLRLHNAYIMYNLWRDEDAWMRCS